MANEPDPSTGVSADLPVAPPLSYLGGDRPLETGEAAPIAASVEYKVLGPEPTWFRYADRVLLVLVLILSFLLGSFAAENSDIWLNLASGRRMQEGTLTLGVDPFSFASEQTATHPAVPWIHHAWLSSWLAYLLFEVGGGPLLVAIKAFFLVTIILILYQIRRSNTNRNLMLYALTLGVLSISLRFLLQPMVISIVCQAVTMLILDRAGLFRSPRAELASKPHILWLLPPLFLIWANLDAWFVLGPLTLLLAWVAVGISAIFRVPSPISAKTLVAVLAVGLLACLVNPFHINVFQLPSELAYRVVLMTEPLGLSLPDSWVAGGRTLDRLINSGEGGIVMEQYTQGTFAMIAKSNISPAVLALIVFMGIGLVAQILSLLVKNHSASLGFSVIRAVFWVGFFLLAIISNRLIPFFAVVAVPMTVLTLSEYLDWQEKNARKPRRSWAPFASTRAITLIFLVVFIVLAWPGWLRNPWVFDYTPYRVAWNIISRDSLRLAAQELEKLQERGEGNLVYNPQPEIGNYCAWYAPHVKYYLDTRLPLFSAEAANASVIRKSLRHSFESYQPGSEWERNFQERGIKQVVVTGFLRDPTARGWWLLDRFWAPRYNDGETAIFAWSGPGKRWPEDQQWHEWNQLAFGSKLPPDARPPQQAPPTLTDGRGYDLFLEGQGSEPLQLSQIKLKYTYYDWIGQNAMYTSRIAAIDAVVPTAVISGMNGGGIAGPASLFSNLVILVDLMPTKAEAEKGKNPVPAIYLQRYKSRDFGPAFVPILAVRLARQAIQENPYHPDVYWALFNSYEYLWSKQEKYWQQNFDDDYARAPGMTYPRDALRHMQEAYALQTALLLQPNNPDLHVKLATIYDRQHLFDLALDYWGLAKEKLKMQNPSHWRSKDDYDRSLAFLVQKHAEQEKSVKERRDDYELSLPQGATPMMRIKQALHTDYSTFDEKNRRTVDRRGRGLVKPALQAIKEIAEKEQDAKAMKPEERIQIDQFQLNLSLQLGQVAPVEAFLDNNAKNLGSFGEFYRMRVACIRGDYAEALKRFANFQHADNEELQRISIPLLSLSLMQRDQQWTPSILPLVAIPYYQNLNGLLPPILDMKTLYATVALEAGETTLALKLFRETLDLARTPQGFHRNFPDLPIALRYYELLSQAQEAEKAKR